MNGKGLSAQALLTAMVAIAGLTPNRVIHSQLSEHESRDILGVIAGDNGVELLAVLDRSIVGELSVADAQVLQTFKQKGVLLLAGGAKPMY